MSQFRLRCNSHVTNNSFMLELDRGKIENQIKINFIISFVTYGD